VQHAYNAASRSGNKACCHTWRRAGAIGLTAVPTGAKSVSVYNETSASITFTITGWGSFVMPPSSTYDMGIPDLRESFTQGGPQNYSVTAIAGNAGPATSFAVPVNPAIYINWTTYS
jgi:hypothetical protein